MPEAPKCLKTCLGKYQNSSCCYVTLEWVAETVTPGYAGWKATAQKDHENLPDLHVASVSESKPHLKSCSPPVLVFSDELGKHIGPFLWLIQGCYGCSPKCWWQVPCFLWAQIWKHGTGIIGKVFSLPFCFTKHVFGVAAAVVYRL